MGLAYFNFVCFFFLFFFSPFSVKCALVYGEKSWLSEVEVLFICLNFNITLNFFYFCTSLYLAGGSEESEGGGEVKVLQNTPRKQTCLFSETLNPSKTFLVIISNAQKLFSLSPIESPHQFQKLLTIFQGSSDSEVPKPWLLRAAGCFHAIIYHRALTFSEVITLVL